MGSCQKNLGRALQGGCVSFATSRPASFKYFKTSLEIIRLAVMLYIRFTLILTSAKHIKLQLVQVPRIHTSSAT